MANEEDEEELDYHVTFPPATGAVIEDGSPSKREPAVILLGWVGCSDKNLAKYSAIYQSKGYTTIRYTAPRSKTFTNPNSLRDIAVKLLDLLFDLGLDENPVVFHVFSNGGIFVYRYCMELLTDGEYPHFMQIKLAGSILDSAPSDPRPQTALKAVYHSRHHTPVMTTLLLMLFYTFIFILQFILPRRLFGFSSLNTLMESIEASPSKRPQLFLYSKADNICDYKRIEEVIARRQALGVEVWQVCWEDSEHVAHFIKHKEEYIDTVLQFVQFCQEN
ncbi:putative transmembrane protein [Apostichopus japonicus]|uniref:Putative transmembrane protein n=1 Tax=Stichopus japonicus TaxID=307972 RepID=A0A2G8K1F5_STIJA|nr:putative transmembrane protein [Apostichopus japonicus]